MGFNQYLQDVGFELQEILWNDGPSGQDGRELDRLRGELYRASAQLTHLRTLVAELRSRLAEHERRVRGLEIRVPIFLHVGDRINAWGHALELDRLRLVLDQDRARLRRCQQAWHAQRLRVRQLEVQLDTFPFEKYPKG